MSRAPPPPSSAATAPFAGVIGFDPIFCAAMNDAPR